MTCLKLQVSGQQTAVFCTLRKVSGTRRTPFLPRSEGIEGGLSTNLPLRNRGNITALMCYCWTGGEPPEADCLYLVSDWPLGAPGEIITEWVDATHL